jgi:flagellar biosynthesis protein FliR
MTLAEALSELGAKTNVSLVIFTVALISARVLPVIILSPFLGGDTVPTEVKIGLGVLMAAVLFPVVQTRLQYIPVSAVPFVLVLLKELFIGVALAFVVNMVFEAARVAGTLVDTLGGTAMAQLMVPQIQQQVSLFSNLKLQFAVVMFHTLDGHHVVLETLADSLVKIPVDRFPDFSGGMWSFFDLMIRVSADLFTIGIALSAPVLLAAFLTDLSLGMINRVAPQVQVFFISMAIKPAVAIIMILVSLHLIIDRFGAEFRAMLRMMGQAVLQLT